MYNGHAEPGKTYLGSCCRLYVFARGLDEDVRVANSMITAAARQQQSLSDSTAAEVQRTKISAMFDSFRGRGRGRQGRALDGPGSLSKSGNPRHDNDHADFRYLPI